MNATYVLQLGKYVRGGRSLGLGAGVIDDDEAVILFDECVDSISNLRVGGLGLRMSRTFEVEHA